MMILKQVLVLAFVIKAVYQSAVYEKVLLNNPAALCLDGTPGSYYYSKGTNKNKLLLYFDGGGWCGSSDISSTIESCYQRSLGGLGSSKWLPSTTYYSEGILSNNIQNSFKDYNKIFLNYCDGSGHQGYRALPVSYKGVNLYFRGQNITVSQINQIEEKYALFSQATDIVVAGNSAGGLAVLLWVNYINKKFPTNNIVAISDSGIFLDFPKFQTSNHIYRNNFINLFKLSNVNAPPPVPQCVQQHQNQTYFCMFAQSLLKHIKVPLFSIQSQYDTWSIQYILKIDCIDFTDLSGCNDQERDYIESYRKKMKEILDQIGNGQQNGLWAPSCARHTFIPYSFFYDKDYRIPMKSPYSIDLALILWKNRQGVPHKYLDQLPWPYNQPCSGLNNIISQIYTQ